MITQKSHHIYYMDVASFVATASKLILANIIIKGYSTMFSCNQNITCGNENLPRKKKTKKKEL